MLLLILAAGDNGAPGLAHFPHIVQYIEDATKYCTEEKAQAA